VRTTREMIRGAAAAAAARARDGETDASSDGSDDDAENVNDVNVERGGVGESEGVVSRVDAGATEEAWEAREKRRRKNKHGKKRRHREGKAESGSDALKARLLTSEMVADDLDSARSSSPVLFDVSGADEKVKESVGARVVAGVAAAQGQRAYMEDRYSAVVDLKPQDMTTCDGVRRSFLGVYDGHNGAWAAEFASERMHTFLPREALEPNTAEHCPEQTSRYNETMKAHLKKMYMDCDEEILDTTQQRGRRDGSTAVCVLQVGAALFTAHAGDSRAVVGYSDGRSRAMTEDHKPSTATERQRVTSVGGRIEFCGCWRVIAEHPTKPVRAALAVSRSLGDIDFKRPTDKGVTAEPDVNRFDLDANINFVILASDGMWDVIRDHEAGEIARAALVSRGVLNGDGEITSNDTNLVEEACNAASKELLDTSMERGTSDNVTVLVAVYIP
jgi:serine/threonine protein phosphatase PrpC